jgi:hypothetical protein
VEDGNALPHLPVLPLLHRLKLVRRLLAQCSWSLPSARHHITSHQNRNHGPLYIV